MTKDESKDELFLSTITEIILSNLDNEQFGVEDLARKVGLSRSQLHRKLKAISRQSASQFIREVRLKKAMELLLEDESPVSEVAYRVGFGSPTYFCKCFHDYYGYPPGESRFRKSLGVVAADSIKKENKSRRGRIVIASMGIVLLWFLGYFLYPFMAGNSKDGVFGEETMDRSIAVLPFKNLSQDLTNQYFTDGMMEDILNRLTLIHELKVISRVSSDKYRDSSKSLPQIAEELGVAYVLVGSVQKYGNKARISVQLLDAKEDRYLWAENYDRELTDIFSIQTNISNKIAGVLQAQISPQEKRRIEQSPTHSLTAYDFYLKGREAYNQYKIRWNELDLETAIQLYKQALELDPNLAIAYSGLAAAHIGGENLGRNKYGCNEKVQDSALLLAQKALELNPDNPEAYIVMGTVYRVRGVVQKAKEAYQKAVELNPNSANTFEILGLLSFLENRYDLQLYYKRKALELDPVSPVRYVDVGYAYLFLDYYDEAEEYYRQAIRLQPDFVYAYGLAGNIFLFKGKLPEALAYFERQLSFNPEDLWSIHHVALAYSWMGNYQEAEKYFRKIQEVVEHPDYRETPLTPFFRHRFAYVLWKTGRKQEALTFFTIQQEKDKRNCRLSIWGATNYYYGLAASNAFLGNEEEAYYWLEKAFTSPCILPSYRFMLQDPLFEKIRKEQRFQQFVEKQQERITKMRHQVDRMEEARLKRTLYK